MIYNIDDDMGHVVLKTQFTWLTTDNTNNKIAIIMIIIAIILEMTPKTTTQEEVSMEKI